MKITEIRFNPGKQKRSGWYRDAQAHHPGATAKWAKDPVTGIWGPTDEYHRYMVDEPHVDADGNPVFTKTFNDPHFRPRTNAKAELTRAGKKGEGHILGTVGEWLHLMGAGPDDLAAARREVLHSPEYLQLTGKLDFIDVSSEGDKKNGTIALEGEIQSLIGSDVPGEKFRRKVLANGQVRAFSSYKGNVNTHHGWRPATFRPFTIENSPELTPHERIVKTMRQSLSQMVRHYTTAALRHFKTSIKKEY